MSLTRDEHGALTDLILQCRARTIEFDQAKRNVELANKELSRFIESLVAPSVPDEKQRFQFQGFYACLRCGDTITAKGYCAKCAANTTAVDAQTQQGGGIGGQDRNREKLRGDSGYR